MEKEGTAPSCHECDHYLQILSSAQAAAYCAPRSTENKQKSRTCSDDIINNNFIIAGKFTKKATQTFTDAFQPRMGLVLAKLHGPEQDHKRSTKNLLS